MLRRPLDQLLLLCLAGCDAFSEDHIGPRDLGRLRLVLYADDANVSDVGVAEKETF